MDALLGIVTRVGGCIVAPIGTQVRYFKDYRKNFTNLQDQVNKLDDMRDDVQLSVNAAINNGGIIKVTVKKWLRDVEQIIAEAQKLNDEDNFDYRCLKRLPSMWLHLKRSKEAFKKALIVTELQGRKPTEDVYITLHPLNIEFVDGAKVGDGFLQAEPDINAAIVGASTSTANKLKIVLKSKTVDEIVAQQRETVKQIIFQQTEAVAQIFDAMQDEECEIILIHGMGGIGKTTLAKEIGKMAKISGLFVEVVLAVVSQNVDIRKIQGQIGDMLGLRFFEESERGRAGRLYQRLATQEKILLILDDVWNSVNLTDIGIPYNVDGKGCKILMTSRQRNICMIMGLQRVKEIPLRLLSDKDAWELFQNHAGLLTNSFAPQLDVAMEVARECGGLPLAVVTVGRSLRDKDVEDWKAALQQLKKSKPLNINDVEKDVFSCLKLSYDNLRSEEAKQCLLLCCLFPEDHDIKIEDLARYGMGKGLFTDVADSMEEARRQTQWIMRSLKDSCLLLDSSKGDCVRMHDTVRDFAILLVSAKNYGFVIKSGLGLKEWPNRETFEQDVIISVMANHIQSLPESLNCPKLEMLLLGENDGFEVIPDEFFQGMKMLRVLDLSERNGAQFLNRCFEFGSGTSELSSSFRLPSSLVALVNLRTLYLDHCKLDDIAILGKLKRLEILSFYGCDISALPNEIGELVNLRLLDLNFCQKLKTVPANLISRLSRLEELYMLGSFREWGAAEGMVEDKSNASLSELTSLSHLTTLCLQVVSPDYVPQNFHIQNLQKFEIIVGWGFDSVTCYPNTRSLYLREIKTSIPEGVKGIAQTTEELTIFCLYNEMVRTILDVDQGGLNGLKSLTVTACVEMVFLMDKPAHNAPAMLTGLEKLHLRLLDDLKYICRWSLPIGSLQKLKVLKVRSCRSLRTTVTAPLLQRLLSLEEVEVESCNEVTIIFELCGIISENELLLLSNLRRISLYFVPKLQSIWRGLDQISHSVSLNKLTVVELTECRHLKYIFPSTIAQNLLHLEVLRLRSCSKLKSYVEKSPGVSVNQNKPAVCFPSLKIIEVYHCMKLENLFSVAEARNLRQLKEINVSSCSGLVELISHEEKGEEGNDDKIILLPKLNSIQIKDMPSITRICAKFFSVDLPSMEELVLVNCPKMENFIDDARKYGLEDAPRLKRAQIGEYALYGTALEKLFTSTEEKGNRKEVYNKDNHQELKPLLKHTE